MYLTSSNNTQFLVSKGNIVISQDIQNGLGVGNHTLTLMVTTNSGTHSCDKQFDLIKEVFGAFVSTDKWYIATNEEFQVQLYLASGFPCFIEWAIKDDGNNVVLKRDTIRQDDVLPDLVEKMSLPNAGMQGNVYFEFKLLVHKYWTILDHVCVQYYELLFSTSTFCRMKISQL